MGRKKLLPCSVLLVRWQFIDPRLSSPLLFDWVVSLIRYGDTREFVFSLLTSIQSEDLILLILVKTQMAVVFYRAVRQFAAPQIRPPCSVPSSLMNSIPAASRRSGRGDSCL